MSRRSRFRVLPLGAALVALAAGLSGPARAEPELKHPDQFYTNGEKVNGWTVNADAKLMSTFWFAKNPRGSLNYQQQIAIVYDDDPERIYYYGVEEKRFVGRFEIRSGKYSMLAPQDRRENREDIDEASFPPAAGLPTVGAMFPQPPGGEAPNDDEMMMPPPTMQFPQFEKSEWDTFYNTPQGRRVRATLRFKGSRGEYRPKGGNVAGELSNVQYVMQADRARFEIRGRWRLGNAAGFFRFRVPMDDLFVYSGFSTFDPNADDGAIWDGVRTK